MSHLRASRDSKYGRCARSDSKLAHLLSPFRNSDFEKTPYFSRQNARRDF